MGVRGIERCVRLQFQTHFADLIVDFVSLRLELDTSHLAGRILGDLWCHDGNWWKEWFWFVRWAQCYLITVRRSGEAECG